jgi:hypothetical protein
VKKTVFQVVLVVAVEHTFCRDGAKASAEEYVVMKNKRIADKEQNRFMFGMS